jgi:hypothetical protein
VNQCNLECIEDFYEWGAQQNRNEDDFVCGRKKLWSEGGGEKIYWDRGNWSLKIMPYKMNVDLLINISPLFCVQFIRFTLFVPFLPGTPMRP